MEYNNFEINLDDTFFKKIGKEGEQLYQEGERRNEQGIKIVKQNCLGRPE